MFPVSKSERFFLLVSFYTDTKNKIIILEEIVHVTLITHICLCAYIHLYFISIYIYAHIHIHGKHQVVYY